MKEPETVFDLFELAIAAEKAAANFYGGLQRLFSHEQSAGLFWGEMMNDELNHLRVLLEIRDSLTDVHLKTPADRMLVAKARRSLKLLAKEIDLRAIDTLDNACDTAYALEYSEVNIVFQSIVSEYVSSAERSDFVLSLVQEHASKIEIFSKTAGDEKWRRSITARPRQ